MGFLDFLFDKEKAEQRRIKKLQKTVKNMYVQPQERQYTLQQLRDIGTPDAYRAILGRYKDSAPNTTVDLEEKEYVYDLLVDASRHDPQVLPIVVEFIKNSETAINWPIKILQDVYDFEQMAEFLQEVLEACSTDYQRDPEKKQEVILRAAEFENEALAKEVARFTEDANEGVRFHAVETLVALGFDEITEPALRELLAEEDSLRIVQRVAQVFDDNHEWTVPAEEREAIELALPEEYALHNKGYIHQKRT